MSACKFSLYIGNVIILIECIGIVFCIRDYISRIRILSILIEYLETSDCTDESRKDETCLQFKMKKHHIKTVKISQ